MATPIPANRARFTVAELLAATGGRALDLDAERALTGVATDSRTALPGGLFVALVGASQDGHSYVEAARQRGVVSLVAAGRELDGQRIEVDDTLVALGEIARYFVARQTTARQVPVLTIGGAAGKTTTKTLAAAAVGALYGETLVTAGNLNNRIGVPMTLLTLAPEHRAAVLECGTSEKGEIAMLGAIARPDVAIVTNVGIEHSAGLGSLVEIADEEADLFDAASRAGVTSADEPLLVERLVHASVATKLLFGSNPASDLRIVDRTVDDSGTTKVVLHLGETISGQRPGVDLIVSTRLLGPAAASNVAAALCATLALLGRPARAEELEVAAAALGEVAAVPGRMALLEIAGVCVLDDSYNSNPKSVAAALSTATEIARRRGARLLLALGDMLELGELSFPEHRRMLIEASACGAAMLVLVGEECARGWSGASLATPFRWYPDSAAAAESIAELVRPGDVLLVKGSRGIRMERLIEALDA